MGERGSLDDGQAGDQGRPVPEGKRNKTRKPDDGKPEGSRRLGVRILMITITVYNEKSNRYAQRYAH
jgi:hypothetical protein